VDPRFERLASAVAEEYAEAGASAVLLAGSVSRGVADRFSDVELGVFWPTEPDAAWEDFECDGVPFETVHVAVAKAETVSSHVGPSLEDLSFASALVDGRPLHGTDLLARWRERVLPYPDELAAAVVRTHGQVDLLWQLDVNLARDNPVMLYARLSDACKAILHALLAANRVYWFGFKRLDEIEMRLAVAPSGLADRVREAFRDAEVVVPLAEETYDIVEQTVPGVDVDRLRRILRYRRTK
jgi:hypothetical protein